MHTISFCFAIFPLANIAIASDAPPYTIARLLATDPFTIVCFAIAPSVSSLTVGLATLVLALISVAIAKQLEAPALALIGAPIALIDATRIVHDYALAMPFPFLVDLTSVY